MLWTSRAVATITVSEMATLEDFASYYYSGDIQDLEGLQFATNLTKLFLQHDNITDVSPLSNLTNLRELNLWANNITDISPLSNLTNLRELRLGRNNITDVSPPERLDQPDMAGA